MRTGKSPLEQIAKRISEQGIAGKIKQRPVGISYVFPNNFYVNSETKESYKAIRPGANGQIVCKAYAHPSDLFLEPIKSQVVGIYSFKTRNCRMTIKSLSELGMRAMPLKITRKKLVVQQLVHAL